MQQSAQNGKNIKYKNKFSNSRLELKAYLSILPFISPKISSTKRIGPHKYEVLSILIGSLLGTTKSSYAINNFLVLRGQITFHSSSTRLCVEPLHNFQLNPYFISGFTDGEGCFSIKVYENKFRGRP